MMSYILLTVIKNGPTFNQGGLTVYNDTISYIIFFLYHLLIYAVKISLFDFLEKNEYWSPVLLICDLEKGGDTVAAEQMERCWHSYTYHPSSPYVHARRALSSPRATTTLPASAGLLVKRIRPCSVGCPLRSLEPWPQCRPVTWSDRSGNPVEIWR